LIVAFLDAAFLVVACAVVPCILVPCVAVLWCDFVGHACSDKLALWRVLLSI